MQPYIRQVENFRALLSLWLWPACKIQVCGFIVMIFWIVNDNLFFAFDRSKKETTFFF